MTYLVATGAEATVVAAPQSRPESRTAAHRLGNFAAHGGRSPGARSWQCAFRRSVFRRSAAGASST
ncbi:MAG: hypothetical protein ACLQVK_03995 [Acidimicrobiales bacterium]